MKLLLVQPPLTLADEVQPPLGLCVLAAYIRQHGHEVHVLDLDLEGKPGASEEAAYLERFAATLRLHRPTVVGVTSMFNNSLHAERLIRAAKRFDPRVVTVAGGSHFGALPRASMVRIPELDFVIRGEGEGALVQLLAALDEGSSPLVIPRVCARTPDGIMENTAAPLIDLVLARPMWESLTEIVDLARYAATIPPDSPRRIVYVEAGRGCPFACSFCATAPFWQRRYRVRPAACIVAEMRHLHEAFGYDTFMLVHDLLTANRHFVDELCDALFAANLPVEWTANHRADINLSDLASKMRRAGCSSVFMGTETASDRIQHEVRKGLSRAQITSTVRTLREVGIASTCSFIIGFPSESAGEISATLGLAAQLKMLGADPVQIHRLRMWPPAPLAALELPAAFDVDALRLEYPNHDVPPGDVALIEADPVFFTGYFTTASEAGNARQLAQLELFFSHAIAFVPIATTLLAALYGERLAESFYRALDALGPLARKDLSDTERARRNLGAFLDGWIAEDERLAAWERELVAGVAEYEWARVGFLIGATDDELAPLVTGAGWSIFPVAVDVPRLLEHLTAGRVPTADLLTAGSIALTRSADSTIRAFGLSDAIATRLRHGDAAAVARLDERAGAPSSVRLAPAG
jgi:radical SAM superfamily enzyme YgiQ (UPF0313 family)